MRRPARLGGDTSFRIPCGGSSCSFANKIGLPSRRKDLPDHCNVDFGFRPARAL
jgi:hypothetical protein